MIRRERLEEAKCRKLLSVDHKRRWRMAWELMPGDAGVI
jgi:hypothetical protein